MCVYVLHMHCAHSAQDGFGWMRYAGSECQLLSTCYLLSIRFSVRIMIE